MGNDKKIIQYYAFEWYKFIKYIIYTIIIIILLNTKRVIIKIS